MKQAVAARIAWVFKREQPEVFDQIVEGFKPQLTDISLIQRMYSYYEGTRSRHCGFDERFNHNLLFICSIFDLFDPGSLYYGAIATKSLCTILARVTGYNHRQEVSDLKSHARVYIKNPRFKARVKELSEELKTATHIGL
ncbi:MAG TPA: hypothetical protein VGB63_16105 [Pedobacter sp.]|jgi:hypothetical protein